MENIVQKYQFNMKKGDKVESKEIKSHQVNVDEKTENIFYFYDETKKPCYAVNVETKQLIIYDKEQYLTMLNKRVSNGHAELQPFFDLVNSKTNKEGNIVVGVKNITLDIKLGLTLEMDDNEQKVGKIKLDATGISVKPLGKGKSYITTSTNTYESFLAEGSLPKNIVELLATNKIKFNESINSKLLELLATTGKLEQKDKLPLTIIDYYEIGKNNSKIAFEKDFKATYVERKINLYRLNRDVILIPSGESAVAININEKSLGRDNKYAIQITRTNKLSGLKKLFKKNNNEEYFAITFTPSEKKNAHRSITLAGLTEEELVEALSFIHNIEITDKNYETRKKNILKMYKLEEIKENTDILYAPKKVKATSAIKNEIVKNIEDNNSKNNDDGNNGDKDEGSSNDNSNPKDNNSNSSEPNQDNNEEHKMDENPEKEFDLREKELEAKQKEQDTKKQEDAEKKQKDAEQQQKDAEKQLKDAKKKKTISYAKTASFSALTGISLLTANPLFFFVAILSYKAEDSVFVNMFEGIKTVAKSFKSMKNDAKAEIAALTDFFKSLREITQSYNNKTPDEQKQLNEEAQFVDEDKFNNLIESISPNILSGKTLEQSFGQNKEYLNKFLSYVNNITDEQYIESLQKNGDLYKEACDTYRKNNSNVTPEQLNEENTKTNICKEYINNDTNKALIIVNDVELVKGLKSEVLKPIKKEEEPTLIPKQPKV